MRTTSSVRLPPCILLLDQHRDTAELYAWALTAAGFRVQYGSFQRPPSLDALPDLVVAHQRQPDITHVRELLGGRLVPTILLTGWLEKGTTAADVGCDVLLQIPVSPTTLVNTVSGLLGHPLAA